MLVAAHRVFKGWGDFDEMRDVLDKTDFSEFEPWEAVVLHWIGESPQLALRCEVVVQYLLAVSHGEEKGRCVGLTPVCLMGACVVECRKNPIAKKLAVEAGR